MVFCFFRILYIYNSGGTFNIIPLSTRGILFPHGEMQRDKMYRLLYAFKRIKRFDRGLFRRKIY